MKRRRVATVVVVLGVAGVVAVLLWGLRERRRPRPVSAGPEPDGAVASAAVVSRGWPRDGGTARQDAAVSATSATITGRIPDELRRCADILVDGTEVEPEDGAFEATVEAVPEREHEVRLIANRLDMQIGRRRLRPGERWDLGTLPPPQPRRLTFTTTSPHPVLLARGSSLWVRDGELKPDEDDSLVFEGSAVVEVSHCDTLAIAQESETGRLSTPVDLRDAEGTVTLEFGTWQPVECASLPDWAVLELHSITWPMLMIDLGSSKGLAPPGRYDVLIEARRGAPEGVSDSRLFSGELGADNGAICPPVWPVGDITIELESGRRILGAYFFHGDGAVRSPPRNAEEASGQLRMYLVIDEPGLDEFFLRHVSWLDTLVCVGVHWWADEETHREPKDVQLHCAHVKRDSLAEHASVRIQIP